MNYVYVDRPVLRLDGTGMPYPPDDVESGLAFSCCYACSTLPQEHRCAGCPRPRRSWAAYAVTEPREPRRRWPWRRKD